MLKKLFFLFCCQLAVFAAVAQHEHHSTDRPSTHGMMVFGTHKVYVSHLPMFHSPHDYQLIAELEIDEASKAAYLAEHQKDPKETVYTLEPETFVLPDMVHNPRPFKASLYRGHFERGGTKFLDNITVKLVRIIYFKKFDPQQTDDDNREYLLLGNEQELFTAHLITSLKPNYDYIATAKVHAGKEEIMKIINAQGYLTYSLSLMQKDVHQPDKAGFAARVLPKEGGKRFTLVVDKQLYLEFDDLKK